MQPTSTDLVSPLPSFRNEQNDPQNSIEILIQQGHGVEALTVLDSLENPQAISNHEKTYEHLFALFQCIDKQAFQILLARLPCFLDLTPNLVEQQYHLAIKLGEQFEKLSDQKNAMICFAKGIKIAEILNNEAFANEVHLKASALLISDSTRAVTKAYHQQLNEFRKMFGTFSGMPDFRIYQAALMDRLRNIFQLFLEDAIGVLGEPPCSFDIRATGSIGREEPSPFPSLESFILIKSDENQKYFIALVKLLELQILSIGETPGDAPAFTCLGKKFERGLRLDSVGKLLIGTPNWIVSTQLVPTINSDETATDPANRVLKSVSLLKKSNPQLFLDFQKRTNVLLNTGNEDKLRSRKITELLNQKLKQFRKIWFKSNLPIAIDLKERYSKYLTYFLSEMALHWSLPETNTLDIINSLVDKGVFTKSSGELLKQSVSTLYILRNNLHLLYGEKKDEGFLEGRSGYIFNKTDKKELEKIYWLVLRPLYHLCLPRVLEGRKKYGGSLLQC